MLTDRSFSFGGVHFLKRLSRRRLRRLKLDFWEKQGVNQAFALRFLVFQSSGSFLQTFDNARVVQILLPREHIFRILKGQALFLDSNHDSGAVQAHHQRGTIRLKGRYDFHIPRSCT